MSSLKLYYSTGNRSTRNFDGQPRKSIGGIRTAQQLPLGGVSQLFGTVSARMLSEGITDYRGFYISNTHGSDPITDLTVYADVPLVAGSTTPPPAPVLNEKYIVPTSATGLWTGKDGKQATWNGSEWVFTFAPFASFEFGFETPSAITIVENSTNLTITEGYVNQLENIFEPPIGIDFYSANGFANRILIGDGTVVAGDWLYVWIKRSVAKVTINTNDLVVDEGGIVDQDDIPLVFDYNI